MTEATTEPGRFKRSSTLPTILIAGLAAAAVDAAYFTSKSLLEGVGPLKVLQGIAGFWLGPAASKGGFASAALGAATHVSLATIMASGFIVFYRIAPKLAEAAVKMGALYGCLLYAIMYGIILPLRWPQIFPSFNGWTSVFDVTVHIAVGITIAAITLSRVEIR